ncbi:MAG: hypothetical protein H6648_03225 [Caldilineae bacterium]|nr:hypothetical protein [Caldilineae bacterium]
MAAILARAGRPEGQTALGLARILLGDGAHEAAGGHRDRIERIDERLAAEPVGALNGGIAPR